jgi:hypothetical protein
MARVDNDPERIRHRFASPVLPKARSGTIATSDGSPAMDLPVHTIIWHTII